MEINEYDLKERHSDELIGCYTTEGGYGHFIDLRGSEGEVVRTFYESGEKVEIRYDNNGLVEHEFYKFKWHLVASSPLTLAVDGEVSPIDKTALLNRLFKIYSDSRGKKIEDEVRTQETILSEVTGAEHTYIYELLQNANDYPHSGEDNDVEVKFILTEHYLLFLHTGAQFNLRNIIGICSFNQGEKRANKDTIGYKGIGFKTVFVNNDYVYLHSGEWKLRFDESYADEKSHGSSPWTIMPIPTANEELDRELKEALACIPSSYRVQFALRHKRDARENIPQLDKVFSDDQILLFIPHVSKAEVYIDGTRKYDVIKDRNKWIVDSFRYKLPDDLKEWVRKNANSGASKIPEKFKDIDSIGISFAVSKDGNKLIPIKNARVYNYLPTELRLDFGFLLNADFIPNGSRSGLHEVKWNDVVMEECGRKFVGWWTGFLKNCDAWDMDSVFSLLPDFGSSNHYASQFFNGFYEGMMETPCIPVEINGNYFLSKIHDVILDEIGLVSGPNPLFTDEEFYSFVGTGKYLPHKNVRNSDSLKELLDETIPGVCDRFDNEKLVSLFRNEAFTKWLSFKENNIRFNQFLIDNDYLSVVDNLPIFLDAEGELKRMGQLYLDVDRYMDDLSFLSDKICRLDPEVRVSLEKLNKWNLVTSKFVQFSDYRFAQKIVSSFSEIRERVIDKDNNVHLLRFLAKSGYGVRLSDLHYPIFTDSGNWLDSYKNLYLPNGLGKEFASQNWVGDDWLNFVDSSYFEIDHDVLKIFFESQGIVRVGEMDLFQEFISNDLYLASIAEQIEDKDTNISFYRFLSSHFGSLKYKFTPNMRRTLTLFATDGEIEVLVPIAAYVYFKSDYWEEVIKNKWLPKELCLVLSSCYGMDSAEGDEIISYFKTLSLAYMFTAPSFCNLLKQERFLTSICNHIKTKEDSKDFLNFLFANKNILFKEDEVIDVKFRYIPVKWDGEEQLKSCKDWGGMTYYHSPALDDLYGQEWFVKGSMHICDEYYTSLFDGQERKEFYKKLGFKSFDTIDFFRRHVLAVIDRFRDSLKDRKANLAFHQYVFRNREALSSDDFKKVQIVPIFIESPSVEDGILMSCSNNHYLPSEALTGIVKADLVPASLLDTIHHDYVTCEEERRYYLESLNNAELTSERFVSYISGEDNLKEVYDYLLDEDRNVRFWRWVLDAKLSGEVKGELSKFPVLGYSSSSSEKKIFTPEELFLSNEYANFDIEKVVKEFTDTPAFVSSCYLRSGDSKKDWLNLFKAVGVMVDTHAIVFEKILPNLDAYFGRMEIIGVLAEHEREIRGILANEENTRMRTLLSKLWLLCDDEHYRHPSDAFLSGGYLNISVDPLADVRIPNLVSAKYLDGYDDKPEVAERIKRFLEAVMDCQKKCLSLTALRNEKLRYFVSHQESYAYEAHLRIIAEMATIFDEEKEDFKEIVKATSIKLYDKNQDLRPSSQLYLGSCYHPDCDYESCDIQTLSYLSEDYRGVIEASYRNAFLGYFQVGQTFKEVNLQLLTNPKFAKYFWGDYAPHKALQLQHICDEEHLRMLPCIPSPTGLKRPVDLYDYREGQLQKIVNSLPDGSYKLPNIELPSWLGYIGFRSRLTFTDCLDYLLLKTNDYRRKVYDWIVETRDETIHRYKREIVEFRENASWYAGTKTWEPLSSLVALDWKNSTLSDSFGTNLHVCNPSFMPEFRQDFERLCHILGIKIISNSDFQKRKTGECYEDTEAKEEIKKRLLYLAYKAGGDWKETYQKNASFLDACDICSCEQIDYFYDENISTTRLSFIEDDDKLWYVGSWGGKMFINVLSWIKRVFSLKQDNNYLESLFAADFNKYLLANEVDLDPEFLGLLDETSRQGLKASDNEEVAEWVETDTSDASLDTSLVDLEVDHSNAPSDLSESDSSFDDHGEGINSFESSKDDVSQPKERKERSDKGKHHAPRRTVNRDEEVFESGDEQKEDLQQALQHKWEQKANKELHRPYSSSRNAGEVPEFSSEESSSSNPGELFGEDNYDFHQRGDTASRMEQNLKRKNTEAQNAAEYADEQLQVNHFLNDTPKYSYLWFKYLMELIYSDKSSLSTSKIQVDFYVKEFLSYDRILRLQVPSKVLPSWLDNADNLQVVVFYKDNSKILRDVSLVRVDETSVDLLVDEMSDETLDLCRQATLIRLKAENSNNILDSLQTRFLQLSLPDEFNMQENLPADISFIYGPPGTGKTTRVVEKIHQLVETSGEKLNILVMTPTNKAADVIAERLVADNLCYNYLSRFGTTEDADLIEEGVVTTRDTMDMDASSVNIVVTTGARFSYDTVNPDDTPICDFDWDYIIIDEASMMDLVTITYILYKGEGARFIIAGDPMQIRPVPRNEIEVENIYQMVGIDELKTALNSFDRYPLEALTTQYRSIPVIGDIVSQFAYNGMVKTFMQRAPQKPLHCDGMDTNTVNFFPFEVREFSQLFELGTVGKSPLHLYSAIFTYNMVGYVARQIHQNHPSSQYSIGVVCPYGAEADAIKQMIESRPIDQPNCSITCGTVHSFQGDECDIMFVVLNPPASSYSGSHVNNQNIINVAMSRARDYLFFVIPEGQIDGYHIKNKLGKIVNSQDRSVLPCAQMEKLMFGDEHYIEENTEVTCHLPVNVYYNSNSEYDVRWDDNAIDIQIHSSNK